MKTLSFRPAGRERGGKPEPPGGDLPKEWRGEGGGRSGVQVVVEAAVVVGRSRRRGRRRGQGRGPRCSRGPEFCIQLQFFRKKLVLRFWTPFWTAK